MILTKEHKAGLAEEVKRIKAAGGEVKLSVNQERVTYWLSQGAQPSERVAQLLKDAAKAAA